METFESRHNYPPPPAHPLNLTHILLEVPGCLKYITLHFYVIVHWHCSFYSVFLHVSPLASTNTPEHFVQTD